MTVHNLYNGTVVLEFDEVKHVYTYDGAVVDGVTTVLDQTLDKSGPLIWWALKKGIEWMKGNWPVDGYVPNLSPLQDSLFEGMRKAHLREKGKAANTGTTAHDWIEGYIKSSMHFGDAPPLPSDLRAQKAVQSFLEWVNSNHVIFRESERRVFSKKHGYAGTLDILADVNSTEAVVDIKTSNSYRAEYSLQTAAYGGAYNEEFGSNIDTRIILMLPKDNDSELQPIIRGPETFQEDHEAFLNALNLYRWKKRHKIGKRRTSSS